MKDRIRKSGEVNVRNEFPEFDALDSVLSDRPSVNPGAVFDISGKALPYSQAMPEHLALLISKPTLEDLQMIVAVVRHLLLLTENNIFYMGTSHLYLLVQSRELLSQTRDRLESFQTLTTTMCKWLKLQSLI